MRKLYAIVVLGLCVGVLFWALQALTSDAKERGKEVKVNVTDLPDAVRATLEKEAPGAEIEEMEKQEEEGKVVYDVDVKIEGKEFELKIAANGTVLKKEAEEEEEKEGEERDEEDKDEGVTVSLGDLPEAVQDTLKIAAPNGEIEEIEKEEEDGKVVYEVDVKIDGKEFELKIAADGTLLKKKAEEGKEGEEENDDEDDDEDGE